MSEVYIVTAKTVDEAMSIANRKYGGGDRDIRFDILEMPKKGFLGIGARDAKIRVTVTEEEFDLRSLLSDKGAGRRENPRKTQTAQPSGKPQAQSQKPSEAKTNPNAPSPAAGSGTQSRNAQQNQKPPRPQKTPNSQNSQNAEQNLQNPGKNQSQNKNQHPNPNPNQSAKQKAQNPPAQAGNGAAAVVSAPAGAPQTPAISEGAAEALLVLSRQQARGGRGRRDNQNSNQNQNQNSNQNQNREKANHGGARNVPQNQNPNRQNAGGAAEMATQPSVVETAAAAGVNTAANPAANPAAADDSKRRCAVTQAEMDCALAFTNTLLENMGLAARAHAASCPEGEEFTVAGEANVYPAIEIEGEGSGILIGHHGETLDAMQYLLNLAAMRGAGDGENGDYVKITLNIEKYREKREETLRSLAQRMAARALKTKRNVFLEPMNAYERRIIHSELQNVPNISTHSVGADKNRKIVITYEGPDKASGDRRRGGSRPARPAPQKEAPVPGEADTPRARPKTERPRPPKPQKLPIESIGEVLADGTEPGQPQA